MQPSMGHKESDSTQQLNNNIWRNLSPLIYMFTFQRRIKPETMETFQSCKPRDSCLIFPLETLISIPKNTRIQNFSKIICSHQGAKFFFLSGDKWDHVYISSPVYNLSVTVQQGQNPILSIWLLLHYPRKCNTLTLSRNLILYFHCKLIEGGYWKLINGHNLQEYNCEKFCWVDFQTVLCFGVIAVSTLL